MLTKFTELQLLTNALSLRMPLGPLLFKCTKIVLLNLFLPKRHLDIKHIIHSDK